MMREIVMLHKKLFHDHAQEFKTTFDLPLDTYWDYVTGFDIVRFDDDLKCPDEISLKDFIANEFGEDASKLIGKLLA